MEELNGRILACQILITGLIARVANDQRDPLRFLSDFRDEIKAVVNGINIAGVDNTERARQGASRARSKPCVLDVEFRTVIRMLTNARL